MPMRMSEQSMTVRRLLLIPGLLGLVLRGVAFEFRFKSDEAHKPFWDKAFAGGSYVIAFFQGVSLGAFMDGFEVVDGAATYMVT